jgi:FMN phosphatase YigB (HAD superfamily)
MPNKAIVFDAYGTLYGVYSVYSNRIGHDQKPILSIHRLSRDTGKPSP